MDKPTVIEKLVTDKTNRLYVKTKKYPNGELIMGKEVDKWLIKAIDKAVEEERERIIEGLNKLTMKNLQQETEILKVIELTKND